MNKDYDSDDDIGTRVYRRGDGRVEKLYNVWTNMKNRCNNPRCKDYAYYGAKGVSVCSEWGESYFAFKDWAYANGYMPDAGLSIDRLDVNGNYCPENCRWVDRKEQANNMSSNRLITLHGETHNISQWAEITGIPYGVLEARLSSYGWSAHEALTTPVNGTRKKYSIDGTYMTLKEIARKFGINYNTLYNRINTYGWDIDKALSERAGVFSG